MHLSDAELAQELRDRGKTNPLLLHMPLPQQEAFKKCLAKIKVLFGGNRSGKTEGVAEYIDEKAIENENWLIWCAALTFSESVSIQQTKIHALMPQHEVVYGNFDDIHGYTNRKLKTKSGTMTVFKSYDQGWEAFQGEAADIIWLDEEPTLDIWKECKMRLIDRDGELLLSMTSLKGVTELVEEVFEGATTIKSRYAKMVDEELPVIAEKNGVMIFFLWTEDNPYINHERMAQEAKLMSKQEIKSRFYGIPVNLQGKIYPKFNKDIHVISREGVDISDCQIWNVLDPHDRKPWAIGWYAIDKEGYVCTVEEYPTGRNFNEMLFDDKTYDEYVRVIKDMETVLLQGIRNKYIKRIIDPNFGKKTMQLTDRQDGSAKTSPIKELKKRGLTYNDAIDSVEAGHLKVREFLYWEEKGGEIVVQPKLFICDNCENHVRHLSRYSRKDITSADGDVKDKVKPKEAYKDYADLVRYLCMAGPRLIKKTNYIPDERKRY